MATARKRDGIDVRVRQERRAAAQPCSHAGCKQPAEFRAPKSRDKLHDYVWLCLGHVREHNLTWDFFKGMSEREIQQFQKDALTGHRPTWILGRRHAKPANGNGHVNGYAFTMDDIYTVLDDGPDGAKARKETARPIRRVTKMEAQSLAVLGLDASASLNEIKARYKELVKRFHPDMNGGDRAAEERLKQVIRAYGMLKAGLAR